MIICDWKGHDWLVIGYYEDGSAIEECRNCNAKRTTKISTSDHTELYDRSVSRRAFLGFTAALLTASYFGGDSIDLGGLWHPDTQQLMYVGQIPITDELLEDSSEYVQIVIDKLWRKHESIWRLEREKDNEICTPES